MLSYTDPAHLTDAEDAILLALVTAALLAALLLGAHTLDPSCYRTGCDRQKILRLLQAAVGRERLTA